MEGPVADELSQNYADSQFKDRSLDNVIIEKPLINDKVRLQHDKDFDITFDTVIK